jgi:hypothetical protein
MNPKTLNTDPNFPSPDEFYAALTDLYAGASNEEAERISARLILLLANHIGDPAVLSEAMTIAGSIKHSAESS